MKKTENIRAAVGEVLEFRWTISRGADTYGYNICTLWNHSGVKLGRCCGGGYDLQGTSFGQWIEARFQPELMAMVKPLVKRDKVTRWDVRTKEWARQERPEFYGLTVYVDGGQTIKRVVLDGGCGFSSMEGILNGLGLAVKYLKESKHSKLYLVGQA